MIVGSNNLYTQDKEKNSYIYIPLLLLLPPKKHLHIIIPHPRYNTSRVAALVRPLTKTDKQRPPFPSDANYPKKFCVGAEAKVVSA
jgi:hypothetical protein